MSLRNPFQISFLTLFFLWQVIVLDLSTFSAGKPLSDIDVGQPRLLESAQLQDANYSECPSASYLQSPLVKANFSWDTFIGTYYEIYYRDYLQYPGCIFGPSCQRSYKKLNYSVGPYGQVQDAFSTHCLGQSYVSHIYDNITTTPGVLDCKWKYIPTNFQDIVVAISNTTVYNEEKQAEQYTWVIELQCIKPEESPRTLYIGINFYCYTNNPSQEIKDEMLAAGREQGLGFYMDGKIFKESVQTNCTYPK